MFMFHVGYCILISNMMYGVTSQVTNLKTFHSDSTSVVNTGIQDGCEGGDCVKGVKRCVFQKAKVKSSQRNIAPIKMPLYQPIQHFNGARRQRFDDINSSAELVKQRDTVAPKTLDIVSVTNTPSNVATTPSFLDKNNNDEESLVKISSGILPLTRQNSAQNYGSRVFPHLYHSYINATLLRSNRTNIIKAEQMKLLSNADSREQKMRFYPLTSNFDQKDIEGIVENAGQQIQNDNLEVLQPVNNDSQTNIGVGNVEASARNEFNNNNFQEERREEYVFIDGQYVREDGLLNRARTGNDNRNRMDQKVPQYSFIDGQHVIENELPRDAVAMPNEMGSKIDDGETGGVSPETPMINVVTPEAPMINVVTPETQMNNVENQKPPVNPVFITCITPTFYTYNGNNQHGYQQQPNQFVDPNQSYLTVIQVWFPRLR